MNKRLKKKYAGLKAEIIIRPKISEDVDKCPTFRTFSIKNMHLLGQKIGKQYITKEQFICINLCWRKFRFRKKKWEELSKLYPEL